MYINPSLHEPPHWIQAPLLQHKPQHKVDLHNTHMKENTQGKNYTQLLEKYVVHIR
jgi:hypothetical protein